MGLATGGEHGGRARLDGTRAEPSIKRPTLAEVGIDKKLSAHARKVASIPEAEFEGIVGEWRETLETANERGAGRLTAPRIYRNVLHRHYMTRGAAF